MARDASPPPASPASRTVAAGLGVAVAAVLLAPGLSRFVPGSLTDEEHVRTALALAVGAAALALSARRALAVPAFALLALGPLAAEVARDVAGAGSSSWTGRAGWLPSLALSCLLLATWSVLAADRLRDDSSWDRFEAALRWTAAAAAAWTVVDALRHVPPVGPFGRAGVAGPTLAALAPFVGRRAWPRRSSIRVGWAVATLLVLAAVVLTGSRTALGALAVGVAVVAWSLRGDRRMRRVAFGATSVVAAGAVAVALSFAGTLPASWSETLRVRGGVAKAAVALAREAPLAGVGLGSFRAEALRVRDLDEARLSRGARPLAAHDDVLHVVAETGVVAGAAFLLVVVGAVVRASRAARRAGGDDPARGAAVARAVSLSTVAFASLLEDPFLAVPTAVAFAAAAGSVPSRALGARASTVARWGLVVLAAAACVRATAGAIADHRVASWRAGGDGALSAEPGTPPIHPEQAYLHAVALAKAGRSAEARAAYAALLAEDPGATEARLDTAETLRREGDLAAARLVLEDARKADPTRFDVPHRLGHLLLGDEPAPSEAVRLADPIPIVRLYDEAHALAPDRFETDVALARVHRRLGDLASADRELKRAVAATGLTASVLRANDAEIFLELFRLGEAQRIPAFEDVKILVYALAANPRLAADVRAEAERFLDVAQREERAAIDAATTTLAPDFRKADADYEAAARRLAGLVLSDEALATEVHAEAIRRAQAGEHRRALAGYRALLTDPWAAVDADLAFEAAKSAARVDPPLAVTLSVRGRTLLGYEALRAGDLPRALRDFEFALGKDAGNVAAKFGLAVALARSGKKDDAGARLREVLASDPTARDRALADPDLRPLVH